MTSELEKIDLIRARLGVGYKEAKEALDLADGDVIQALISLEQKNRDWQEKLQGKGNEFVSQVKHIVEKGQKTRVKVKKDDKTVVEFPATIGALGVLGAMASTPVLIIGALGSIVGLANNYRLEFGDQKDQWQPDVEVPGNQDPYNPKH